MYTIATPPIEVWRQDHQDSDLWHGNHGLIVNNVALKERETYFEVIRVYDRSRLYSPTQALYAK